MTLDIKVFSKSLTIDTHYARNPDAFPVNITGSALNFFVTDTSGANKISQALAQTSIYTTFDSSYKTFPIKNNSKYFHIQNNNNVAFTTPVLTSPQIVTTIPKDNTSLVLTENSSSDTFIYTEVQNSTTHATVHTNYNTSNYYVSGNYETADDNLPTGTRVIVTTLKNLSSDGADTTAPTVDETEVYQFPAIASFQTTEYSDNILQTGFNTTKQLISAGFKNNKIEIYVAPNNGTNAYSDNITVEQIKATIQPTIVSYTDTNKQIMIDNVQNIDISNVKQKQIQIVSQTDKGAVSKSKADTATLSMFILNEANIAYFDLDGYISFQQVTPFNDPIPPSDSTTGGGDTGGDTGGGTGTTTGPIQSWSS